MGSKGSAPAVAAVRFQPRFPLPAVEPSACTIPFAIFLASLAIFLAFFSAFAASFTACSDRAFSSSSHVVTFDFPSIADLAAQRGLLSSFILARNLFWSWRRAFLARSVWAAFETFY
ncbi:hypothetical protein EJ04DRAFT_196341 [Polyplosphaeria fusca]|uniref:Transmembrane protein n=1 Tax=Polyplosphaeria fusca TaxID=682080 RepID=A0A9P4QHL8_9PLEO|nr:hypothetical protein EJ04DRAFT_196341 [Polyplosphaeria fusca]